MEERAQLHALLDASSDLLALVDDDGEIQYVNAASERLLAGDADARTDTLVGQQLSEYVHPDDESRLQAAIDAVTTGLSESSPRLTYRCRAADGSWASLDARLSATEPDSGSYLLTARVVSDGREPGSVRSSNPDRTYLRDLTETSNEVLWMFTADWEELLFVNSAYESVWGRSLSVLYEDASDFLEGVHPDDRERVEQAMGRLTNGTAVDIEYRIERPAEDSRWVWVQGEPVFEDGEVVRVVGFARDVTERHERTRQLQVIDRVLRHNLRNSMNIVLGYAAELDGTVDDDGTRSLTRLRAEGERLLDIADKQRELVDVLTTELQSDTVDIGHVVRETVDAVAPEYPECRITTQIDEGATALAFPKIDLAIRELVVNALEHCDGDDPAVEVSVRVDAETVVIEVRDRNPPIPVQNTMVLTGEREIADLFHGDGVGLWLVYWLFERSNGEVTFSENEPDGNCVRGLLPRTERT
ncbi:PAS domain S-box-containing protein [Halogranum gelatinilyticum]|uniref:histidine kinase n=1 Tax=Halogranum gelatinilyticum TaxID=660521 RepID=A0A1G9W4H6_9EURY|nr:PAS domain-containing protein [Halogranum gelatinilyticum]SDM79438.1 PAS domain S-box-containing protein [Halogranum gelatinilyticum]